MNQEIKTDNLIQAYAYMEDSKQIILVEDFYFDSEYNLYSNRIKKKLKIIKPNLHTEKSKPTIVIHHLNRQAFSMESLIIGTFFIKPNLTKVVNDKNYDYLTLLKAGWGVIYKDGNIHNYNAKNMSLVSMVAYFKWCKETGHKIVLTDTRKDIIIRWAKRHNNTGSGTDGYEMAKHFYITYKSVRKIMGNQN